MKLLSFITILFALVLTTYAGPTTNQEEYKGDTLLTPQQQEEYTQRLEQGIQYFESGKYDLAETEFKKILSFAPKKALAYFNLGLTKYKQGDFPEAIKNFDQVIKMKSYYVGAAFYYKAISQLNLEKNEEAAKTAKRFTQARFFYEPSQSLIKTIQTGTDEYYENAQLALADTNYELCLLEMDQSVLTDTRKGRELVSKCQIGLKTVPVPTPGAPPPVVKNYYYSLYFGTHLSQTDNVYQENTNTLKKLTYFTELSGEFVSRNTVDVGIGFGYSQYNAIDLPRFKDETYNVNVPLYYRSNNHHYGAEGFYNLNKYDGQDSYSDIGLNLNYSYTETNKYLMGFVGSTFARNSRTTNFDYRTGTVNSARFLASRFMNEVTLSANVGFEQTLSGDQPWGAFTLPFANRTTSYGLNASYDFNTTSRLSLRSSFANKDYANKIAPSTIFRADKTTSFVLAYQHKFNNTVRAYLQQSMIKNTSNYDDTEFINKNYTENLTTLGLTLFTY